MDTQDSGAAARHNTTCARECEACALACDACVAALGRSTSADLFRDCASVCRLTAELFDRESRFAGQLSQQCARICAACIAECRLHEGSVFSGCAKACEACIRHCG